MIANIYINGLIGDEYNENGDLVTKGVMLQDVIMQVEANKMADIYHIYITSQGGSVHVGDAIHDYIKTLDNAVTIAKDLCGSIATKIHLARPLHQRKMVAGTEYFIHNPLLSNISGNADELERAAAHVRPYEKEMAAMYVKATGISKEAIEGLMKQETSLTDEQCKTLGFVIEVLPKMELKAVAFYDKNNNNKNQNLDKMEKSIMDKLVSKIKAELGITKEVKSMMATTDKGTLVWASENALPTEGEAVTMEDGSAAEVGDYTMEDGTVITVGDGSVVTMVTAPASAEVEALKQKIAELEAAQATMKAEFDTEKETMLSQFDEKLNELQAAIGSNYVPKAEKKQFNKNAQPIKKSMKELAAERETTYRKK